MKSDSIIWFSTVLVHYPGNVATMLGIDVQILIVAQEAVVLFTTLLVVVAMV